MKATIDFDDVLYRRLKVEAARRGVTIRALVDLGVREVLGVPAQVRERASADTPWFGLLNAYAKNAKGKHDLASVRESIAKARTAKVRTGKTR